MARGLVRGTGQHGGQGGFTLIEMLVAVGILALVGVAFMAALGFESDPEPARVGQVEVASLTWPGEDGASGFEATAVPEPAGTAQVAISQLAPTRAPAPGETRIEPRRPVAVAARQAPVPTLDETQWAALVASLPSAANRAEPRPPPPTALKPIPSVL